MSIYEEKALREMLNWQKEITKEPSMTDGLTKGFQTKMNSLIPEKAHVIITDAIKAMVKAAITGSEYTTKTPLYNENLEGREQILRERIDFYKKTAAISGAGTGAGGIFLGLADFPILLSLKMKFLFEAASIYGFNVKNYKERLYILYVFQLAFSSKERRNEVYKIVSNWENYTKKLPGNEDAFDWRIFQQEYRDYIDVAKLLQLVPGIGAAVGAYANYKLLDKLGETAMNSYRIRIFKFQ